MININDEILFYGGLCVAVAALLAAIIFFCVSRAKTARLKKTLEEEYGNTIDR